VGRGVPKTCSSSAVAELFLIDPSRTRHLCSSSRTARTTLRSTPAGPSQPVSRRRRLDGVGPRDPYVRLRRPASECRRVSSPTRSDAAPVPAPDRQGSDQQAPGPPRNRLPPADCCPRLHPGQCCTWARSSARKCPGTPERKRSDAAEYWIAGAERYPFRRPSAENLRWAESSAVNIVLRTPGLGALPTLRPLKQP
jgi:hypothetical protein